MSKLKEYIEFKPQYEKYVKGEGFMTLNYTTSFYCQTNFLIHPNLKAAINCPSCFTDEDRKTFKETK